MPLHLQMLRSNPGSVSESNNVELTPAEAPNLSNPKSLGFVCDFVEGVFGLFITYVAVEGFFILNKIDNF